MAGNLFVLSGPSGVGKGTVLNRLLKESLNIKCSISYTTRKPRYGEVEGEDYYFVDKDKFLEMRDNDEFVEWAQVHNNYYGTPRKQIKEALNRNENLILEIDIQGAKQIKKQFCDAIMIFLVPPSFKELKKRLEKRGSEDNKSKNIRLSNAKDELNCCMDYDYKVVNDRLAETVSEVKKIIIKEISK